MKCSVKIVLLVLMACYGAAAHSQMIIAPVKKTPPPPPPAAKKKIIKAKFEEDDNPPVQAVVEKKEPDYFARIGLKANKGADISISINDSAVGKIKANKARTINVDNEDYLVIRMDDNQGMIYDTTLYIDASAKGQTLWVNFPERDYDAIRAEAERAKREQELAEKLVRDAETRSKRKEQLTQYQTNLSQSVANVQAASAAFSSIIETIDTELKALEDAKTKLISGETNSLEDVEAALLSFNSQKESYIASKKQALETIDAAKTTEETSLTKDDIDDEETLGLKTAILTLKETLAAEKSKINNSSKEIEARLGKETVSAFVRDVKEGKKSMSGNAQIAFSRSRVKDLKFYVPADSMNAPMFKGKTPLFYAIEMNSNGSVFDYLFANGAEVNNFKNRFADNAEVYSTPFSTVAIEYGDTAAVGAFIRAGASFYPSSATKRERRLNAKHILAKLKDKPQVIETLKAYNAMPDDGSTAMSETVAFLDTAMVSLAGGSFSIGCINYQQWSTCSVDEKPNVTISVSPFSIAKYEVTQKQWASVMDEDNPSEFKGCDNCPVENVSWEEVQEFIKRLNEFSGKKYRLPTEAEWEYAAKGGGKDSTVLNYAGGENLREVGWFKDNSGNKTHEFGQKKPNSAGIYDMTGNVYEWCSDWYQNDYYKFIEKVDPKGPSEGSLKVAKGGAWSKSDHAARNSNREELAPTYKSNFLGFRLALSN